MTWAKTVRFSLPRVAPDTWMVRNIEVDQGFWWFLMVFDGFWATCAHHVWTFGATLLSDNFVVHNLPGDTCAVCGGMDIQKKKIRKDPYEKAFSLFRSSKKWLYISYYSPIDMLILLLKFPMISSLLSNFFFIMLIFPLIFPLLNNYQWWYYSQ
jgi:hypothetical protein